MITVVILRTQSETRHCAVIPGGGEVWVSEEVCHGEVVAFDPEFAGFFDGRIDDDSGVGDAYGFGGVVLLEDGTSAGSVLTDEEVFECAVLVEVGGFEVVHVDVEEVDEGLDLLCGRGGALTLS
jgi:hypothetical protein